MEAIGSTMPMAFVRQRHDPRDRVPETRGIHRAGGRYLTLVGNNQLFSHAAGSLVARRRYQRSRARGRRRIPSRRQADALSRTLRPQALRISHWDTQRACRLQNCALPGIRFPKRLPTADSAEGLNRSRGNLWQGKGIGE
jgi:hypothetical protein